MATPVSVLPTYPNLVPSPLENAYVPSFSLISEQSPCHPHLLPYKGLFSLSLFGAFENRKGLDHLASSPMSFRDWIHRLAQGCICGPPSTVETDAEMGMG